MRCSSSLPVRFGPCYSYGPPVGSGIGAENGVLIRRGEAVQAMKDVKVVVFDKTGTITKGKPEVTDIILASGREATGFSENDLLALAAGAESRSEHPLATAVMKGAEARGLTVEPPEDFVAIPGKGVAARVAGRRVLVGSRRLMQDEGIDTSGIEDALRRLEEEAKTGMIVAAQGTVYGLIAVADPLKDDSSAAIRGSKPWGLDTAIVGDNSLMAQVIAKKVGIAHQWPSLADGKVEAITDFRRDSNNRDGRRRHHDAPALARRTSG